MPMAKWKGRFSLRALHALESVDGVLREVLEPQRVLAPLLVSKGSVAVDGVSLTVNEPSGDRFWITLVPHTLSQTALADLRPGAKVNLEADILGKYIAHFLNRSGQAAGKVDESFLAEHGFWNGESG